MKGSRMKYQSSTSPIAKETQTFWRTHVLAVQNNTPVSVKLARIVLSEYVNPEVLRRQISPHHICQHMDNI